MPSIRLDLACPSPGVKDFTFYPKLSDLTESWQRLDVDVQDDAEIVFAKSGDQCKGRGAACRVFDGSVISLTVRRDPLLGEKLVEPPVLTDPAPKLWDAGPSRYSNGDKTWQTRPSGILFNTEYAPHLSPSEASCRLLCQHLFLQGTNDAKGLIVVAGETGSFKSTIVRGMLALFLASSVEANARVKNAKEQRRPHLVTYEDPVEKFLWEQNAIPGDRAVDYSPRQPDPKLGGPTLAQVAACALRQKPAVLYVGEVRDRDQWREILHFAGTGHLVITTTHAGSLVETMSKILSAVEAHSPALRGQYAGRIRGVVHLRTLKAADGKQKTQMMSAPAVWVGTTANRAALVTDGLSSVLPHRQTNYGEHPSGRFLNLQSILSIIPEDHKDHPDAVAQTGLLRQALALDLQGE